MIKNRDFDSFFSVSPKANKSSSRILELNKLGAKPDVSTRRNSLNKLAATVSRKDVDLELKKIRSDYSKSLQNYERANTELSNKQQEVDSYQAEMNAARQRLIELSKHVQTMDLTNADGLYSAKDETFYVIDGRKYHVDSSDVADIKMTPIKEWRVQNNSVVEDEEADCADTSSEIAPDISLVDDIFASLNAPRFE